VLLLILELERTRTTLYANPHVFILGIKLIKKIAVLGKFDDGVVFLEKKNIISY